MFAAWGFDVQVENIEMRTFRKYLLGNIKENGDYWRRRFASSI